MSVEETKSLQYQSTNRESRCAEGETFDYYYIYGLLFVGAIMMHLPYEEDTTIPHVTRHDTVKTGLYAVVGLAIALTLLFGTVWLFVAG